MSIKPTAYTGNDQQDDLYYALSPPVRVRKETFGLLFYNMDDSRLTFVKSGNLLQITALPHGAKRITVHPESENKEKVIKLLDRLLQKRLICES